MIALTIIVMYASSCRFVEIQSRLFDVGAAVATPISASADKREYTKVLFPLVPIKKKTHHRRHSQSTFFVIFFLSLLFFSLTRLLPPHWRNGLMRWMLNCLHSKISSFRLEILDNAAPSSAKLNVYYSLHCD